jgi:arylsulfatase A-like enzyme
MTDDQTVEQMKVLPRTRALIGDAGASFESSFVSFPLCCPSRASFLTGQYPHNHRVLENYPPRGGFQRLDADETLAVWLSRAGYFTGQIGKLMNGYSTSPVGVPPGWAEWHGEKTENRYYGYGLYENGRTVTYGDPEENPEDPADPASYSTDVYTRKAIDFIAAHAPSAQPFFLWVSYNAPHSGGPDPPPSVHSRCRGNAKPAQRHLGAFAGEPMPRPPSFAEADVSDKPRSLRAIEPLDEADAGNIQQVYRCELESLLAVDEGVERIVGALAASGELDDTALIFTSDNGFFHGEHRISFGKNRVYEEAIRVPLLIRGPGIVPGTEVEEPVVNIDLAPTILDYAGARARIPQDGRSLLPLAARPERLRGREILIDTNTYKAIRTPRYVYAEHFARADRGERELYDLRRDPYQLESRHRVKRLADVRRALADRLDALRVCDGAECRLRPRLKLGVEACDPRFVVLEVRGGDAGDVVETRFMLRGRGVRRDRGAPFRSRLPLRRLRRSKSAVEAVATLIDGRRVTISRRVRCAAP